MNLRRLLTDFEARGADALALLDLLSGVPVAPRRVLIHGLLVLSPYVLAQELSHARFALRAALRRGGAPRSRADYARDWAVYRGFTAALGQAMLWAVEPSTRAPLPKVRATEPWERQQQIARRAAALAERPMPDFSDAHAVQAASLRGDHALACLLGAHANLPPHAMHALQSRSEMLQGFSLSEGEAAQGAAYAWHGAGPLPSALVEHLRSAFLPLDRHGLAELFAFCDGLALPETRAMPLRIAALEALTAQAGASIDARPFACAVCETAVSQHTHLGGCDCAPALCDGCAAEAVTRVGNRLTCPTACPAPLNREYLERLGVAPAVVQRRLIALHREQLSRVPEWTLDSDGLGGHYDPPPPVHPDAIPAIRAGQHRPTLRLLLSGLAASSNCNGDGVHRECYQCAQPVQKGDACLHMQCQGAHPHHWDFERGPYDQQPRFATNGLQAQGYIPLARGPLARAGFYAGLPPGVLSAATRARVERRSEAWLAQLGGAVAMQEEHQLLREGGDFHGLDEV